MLINGRSASASEWLAASLQDWGRAVVIGSATDGKGSVQNVARMPNGGELIITWSRMHAPSGYVLDRLGVLPGVCTSHPGGADAQPSDSGAPDSRAPDARASVRYAIESDFVAWPPYDPSDDAVARPDEARAGN